MIAITQIKNCKATLFGADTHSAVLTGSDTHSASLTGSDTHGASLSGSLSTQNPIRIGDGGYACGKQSTNQAGNNTIGTVVVTPTNSTNKVLLVFRVDSSQVDGTTNLEILEGSTSLGTQGLSAGTNTLTVLLTNVSASAHTYTFRLTYVSGLGYQYGTGVAGISGNNSWRPPLMEAYVIDYNDTHSASLTGSDTHGAQLNGSDTHGAQLNGSDTHRVVEEEIIA